MLNVLYLHGMQNIIPMNLNQLLVDDVLYK